MTEVEADDEEPFDVILDDSGEIEFEYDPLRASALRLRTKRTGEVLIHMHPLQVSRLFRKLEEHLRGY
jgi:hypothetical protein